MNEFIDEDDDVSGDDENEDDMEYDEEDDGLAIRNIESKSSFSKRSSKGKRNRDDDEGEISRETNRKLSQTHHQQSGNKKVSSNKGPKMYAMGDSDHVVDNKSTLADRVNDLNTTAGAFGSEYKYSRGGSKKHDPTYDVDTGFTGRGGRGAGGRGAGGRGSGGRGRGRGSEGRGRGRGASGGRGGGREGRGNNPGRGRGGNEKNYNHSSRR